MGAKIYDAQHGFIYCEADKLKGTEILLEYPSVGATENVMLAAVFASGETCLRNPAKEPEIVDLQNYLRAMGADVSGAGTDMIRIKGVTKLSGYVEHEVIPDRIVAGTYMTAAAITGGNIVIKNVIHEHVASIVHVLRDCGCDIRIGKNEICVNGPARPKAVDTIRTLPYPGFPTDMQAQMVALLSIAKGTSIVVETVFENRYKHVEELLRMGADIKLAGRVAVINGVKGLTGANVTSWDLRGGAALVLAGLAAEGETVVSGTRHIDRGYECIEEKLRMVGADIRREE